MDFLDLDGQTGVLLLDGLANGLVPPLVLPVLLPHQVVAVLDRPPDLVLSGTHEVELHYGIVLELALSNKVETALSFREDGEEGQEVVRRGEPFEVFEDEVGVFPELDEKILVGLDSFELPVVALEDEVEVHFGVAGEFYLQSFGEAVLVLDHDLDPQQLRFLQDLGSFWFFLDANGEGVFAVVDYLAGLLEGRVPHLRRQIYLQDVHDGLLQRFLHQSISDYIEIKISVRKWLIRQGKMPPFLEQFLETLFLHHHPQQIPFLQTLLRHQPAVLV